MGALQLELNYMKGWLHPEYPEPRHAKETPQEREGGEEVTVLPPPQADRLANKARLWLRFFCEAE